MVFSLGLQSPQVNFCCKVSAHTSIPQPCPGVLLLGISSTQEVPICGNKAPIHLCHTNRVSTGSAHSFSESYHHGWIISSSKNHWVITQVRAQKPSYLGCDLSFLTYSFRLCIIYLLIPLFFPYTKYRGYAQFQFISSKIAFCIAIPWPHNK